MGTLGNQPSWPPYDNIKDCSQGFCSLYCPQWCYIIFPPPPPYYPEDDDSGTSFSPLVIAIIGILASAFLLVSYYTVISKYCRNVSSSQRNGENDPSDEHNENQNPSNDETWQVSRAGLDETLIKSIAVCKYKRGDGLVEGTDCSVCLSEFEEDESLRLLPKCSHAFHLSCIDTWLKSHSNCPLCRANVVPTSPLTIQMVPPVQPSPSSSQVENNIVPAAEDSERRNEDSANEQNDVVPQDGVVPKTSDVLGGLERRDIVIEIREDGSQHVRRSVSMDATCHVRNSVADILCTSEDEAWPIDMDDEQHHLEVESSSKHGSTKCNNRSKMLHCVGSPVPMKRSFSGGRFTLTRQGRGKNVLLPM